MITLAKALKHKNRLAERIRKISEDIQNFNSVPANAEKTVNVRVLCKTREELVEKLVELKCKLMVANGPIWNHIFSLAEIKGEIAFWTHVKTQHGKNFSERYMATEVLEYSAEFKKPEVDAKVLELETKADALQEQIDQHNYTTKIDFVLS